MYVDGVLVTTWTSSGMTDGFESIDLSETSGTTIEIVGVLDSFEWLSIIEVSHVAQQSSGTTPGQKVWASPPASSVSTSMSALLKCSIGEESATIGYKGKRKTKCCGNAPKYPQKSVAMFSHRPSVYGGLILAEG